MNLVTQLVKEKKAGFVLFALMAQPSRTQIPMKEVMTNPIKHTNQCFVKICPEPVSSVTQSDEYILLLQENLELEVRKQLSGTLAVLFLV